MDRLVGEFERAQGDMSTERIDGEESSYERMVEAVESLPFLSQRKLVVLRIPGANKIFAEKFTDFLSRIADTTDVIILEPRLDKRLSYYKLLKKQTEFRDFAVLDTNHLVRFAQQYAKNHGGNLSSTDARLLLERIGTNQASLQHELDKLLSYSANITEESVNLLTERTPQSSIFDLVEAAFGGDARRTLALYNEQRALQVDTGNIVAMLAWQLHAIAVVRTAGNRSADEIARSAKMNPYVVRKTQSLSARLSLTRLKEFVTTLRQLDVRMKTESVLPDDVLRYYLLMLAS